VPSGWLGETWSGLVDLVLPGTCAGCDAATARAGLCDACDAAFVGASPARVLPQPAPAGLPRCLALAAYDGALRAALLAYKERGRYALAAPLGDRLADVVVAGRPAAPVRLVPVPATAAAARARYGDHMARLARRAARRLTRLGYQTTVAHLLRARPRPDSAGLSSAARATAAASAFTLRRAAFDGAPVVLVDDIITTGATLTAAADLLRAAGLRISMAAVLAATPRRTPPACRVGDPRRRIARSG
jgi:ComF family protein